jgi:hypothetical protein
MSQLYSQYINQTNMAQYSVQLLGQFWMQFNITREPSSPRFLLLKSSTALLNCFKVQCWFKSPELRVSSKTQYSEGLFSADNERLLERGDDQ